MKNEKKLSKEQLEQVEGGSKFAYETLDIDDIDFPIIPDPDELTDDITLDR
ncbi:MAG: hypothetical protein HUJ63_07200 [Enterococcus sp.]|nr:hypothetical protein [Enterococcus sp.]